MREAPGLSSAFIEAHPADAARVLEDLGAADTAAVVATLPLRLVAPALRMLGPPYCARVFDALPAARASELLQQMGPQAAARVLRQTRTERQQELLGMIPVGTAIALRLLIGYPKGTCGACMDPWPLALLPDMPASDAIEETRRFQGDLGDCLFVSSAQRRLLGVVPIGGLLRTGAREPLKAIMAAPVHVISALELTAAAIRHAGWEHYHVLPVVERESRLVGAMHRHALTNSLATPESRAAAAASGGLFGAYWHAVAALTEVVIESLPPVSTVADERSADGR